MVGAAQVVVDGFRNANAAQFPALFFAVLFHTANRVHRVVAPSQEVVTNVVLLEHLQSGGEIAVLELVSARAKSAGGRVLQTFDNRGIFFAQIDNFIFHEPFDAVAHAVDMFNGFLFEGFLNNAAQRRVNNRGRTAGLTDNSVSFKHLKILLGKIWGK